MPASVPPLEFITSVPLVMLTVPETLLNWSIGVPLPIAREPAPVLLKMPLLLTMPVPPLILLKLPLPVRLTVPKVRLLKVLVDSRLMWAPPTSTMPLLFQVLVTRLPPLWVVVPEVFSAPSPLMAPPLQLNAPPTFKLPAAEIVPLPTLKAEFASIDESCASVSEPPPLRETALTFPPPALVTVRLLADSAVLTVMVLVVPPVAITASALEFGVPRSQLLLMFQLPLTPV